MTCREISELLSSYLDNELEHELYGRVKEHVRSCTRCQVRLEELRQVKHALQSLPEVDPPAELHLRIMNAISEESKRKPRFSLNQTWQQLKKTSARNGRFKKIGLVLAACLVLMLVSSAGTVFVMRQYGILGSGSKAIGRDFESAAEPGMVEKVDLPSSPEDGDPSFDSSGGPSIFKFESSEAPSADVEPEYSPDKSADIRSTAQSLEIQHKLIRRASLTLEVSKGSVDHTSQEIIHVVKNSQGYVESSSMSVAQGKNRFTVFYMTARVPSERLDQSIQEISSLGEVTQSDTSVQDVTDQYVDLDARIRSKELEEQRLLTILGNANTVGELLQVEGELSRVRSDIETLKGRQNVLEKSSSLSFLSVSVVEEGARKREPSPWREVWKAFLDAWHNLLVFLAKVAPAIIVVAAAYFIVRRSLGKKP